MVKIVKILGHEYKVFHENIGFKEGTSAIINVASLEIRICNSYPESRQREGLIHEIIEALDYHLNLKLPHSKIIQLGEAFYQVLKENPDLLKG